jgi:hypothetical protein
MTPPVGSLYADADVDIIAALYTTFLALDPVLSLDAAASLDTAVSARPRHHLPHPRRRPGAGP